MLKRTLTTTLAAALSIAVLSAGNGTSKARAELTYEDLASVPQLGAPVLSPDGKQFALIRDGQIVLAPADGTWPVTLTSRTGGKSGLAWSPGGDAIAFVSGGHIWVVPSAGGQPLRLTDGTPGAGDPRSAADRQPAWSPDGKWLLFESGRRGNADLRVVSRDGLTSHFATSTDTDEAAAAWSPDGRRIAYVERSPEHFSGRLLDLDPSTARPLGEPRERYVAKADRGGGWSIDRPVWSPDGSQLAVVLQESGWDHLYLLPATGGPARALTQGSYEAGAPVFSPDGKAIAFTSNQSNLEERHIWIVPAGGGPARRLTKPIVGVESAP